ncbi:hypothetical protein Ct9H90mP12_1670 [bacterium]|nr:MAG: hypothetical protein Ct9H90mP12_1670 [bacterium]
MVSGSIPRGIRKFNKSNDTQCFRESINWVFTTRIWLFYRTRGSISFSNELRGFPFRVRDLVYLSEFIAHDNQLTGSIPEQFGTLKV